VLITSREAILSVPDDYRDASAALGVSKWQTIRSVVPPAAIPGVTTGVILGVGRIAGETAPILLTMGGGVLPAKSAAPNVLGSFQLSGSPPFVSNPALLEATSALPYQLYALITAGAEWKHPEPTRVRVGAGTDAAARCVDLLRDRYHDALLLQTETPPMSQTDTAETTANRTDGQEVSTTAGETVEETRSEWTDYAAGGETKLASRTSTFTTATTMR